MIVLGPVPDHVHGIPHLRIGEAEKFLHFPPSGPKGETATGTRAEIPAKQRLTYLSPLSHRF